MMSIWAIVPVKRLLHAKSRLAGVLTRDERVALMERLTAYTLGVLEQVAGLARILVVTNDPHVGRLAQACGALTLREPPAAGLNGALALGVDFARLQGATQTLLLPADLPFLTPADVVSQLAASGHGRIVICSDHEHSGTNALLLPTQVDFQLQYGPGSFERHCREAWRLGLGCCEVARPGLRFDLDTAVDWEHYCTVSSCQVRNRGWPWVNGPRVRQAR